MFGRFGEIERGRQLGSGRAAAVRTDVPALRGEKIGADTQLRSFPQAAQTETPDAPAQLDEEPTMSRAPTIV